MPVLHSRGEMIEGQISWILEGHEFDFTLTEFLELTDWLRNQGLFEWLEKNRSSLKDRLNHLYSIEFFEFLEEEDFEHTLERLLMDLRSSLRL